MNNPKIPLSNGPQEPNQPPKPLMPWYLIFRILFAAFVFIMAIVLPTLQHSDNDEQIKETAFALECEGNRLTDYVIISRKRFRQTLQPFMEWKEEEGFNVIFKDVVDIDQEYDGHDTSARIKEFVKENACNAKYFLLVGDTQVHKDFKFSVTSDEEILKNVEGMYNIYTPWNVPSGYMVLGEEGDEDYAMMLSDTYYADLDDWDKDDNGVLDVLLMWEDFAFETIVSRWTVRTTEELKRVIQKTMDMQPTSHISFWINDEFRVYSPDELEGICANYREDWLEKGSVDTECLDYFIFKNSENISQSIEFVPAEEAETGNKRFIEYFLNTDHAVYEELHGSKYSIEGMTTGDVNKFTKIIPFLMPLSCAVVHYYIDDLDTFSEALLKAKKGPAVIAFPLNEFGFIKGLVDGKTIGEAYYNPNEVKWHYSRWHTLLLGDPSLKPFL